MITTIPDSAPAAAPIPTPASSRHPHPCLTKDGFTGKAVKEEILQPISTSPTYHLSHIPTHLSFLFFGSIPLSVKFSSLFEYFSFVLGRNLGGVFSASSTRYR